ncbi:hypothetical protein [Aliiruegeria lutimaris]|uniref:Uncharacterized protein n=1 Tax=Aliiruegeria lutimaris TaxID=571298 RepID=A0A1G8XQ59_9RHOB|nr:hypothetical protein [Aliiruegeria lutimaris]SDJ92668.1 hypothetical protein SAMN04488026_10275 [Aliiruegeria lutimaris]
MISALRYFISKQPVVFGICVAASLFTLFFAVQFLAHFIWMQDPANRDQSLEGWMRPRYVAMSWHVPPDVVREALELGPPPKERGREPLTMADIAVAQGVSLEQLTARVALAAEAFRTRHDR